MSASSESIDRLPEPELPYSEFMSSLPDNVTPSDVVNAVTDLEDYLIDHREPYYSRTRAAIETAYAVLGPIVREYQVHRAALRLAAEAPGENAENI